MNSSSRNDRKIVAITSSSHFMIHSYEFIFPAILVMIGHEFGIHYGLLGLLANVSYLFIGLGSLPAGFISDRLGSTKTLIIYLIGAALSSLLIAFSYNFYSLTTGLILLGAFLSIYHPAGLSLLSKHSKNIGTSFGIHGMAGNLGAALAPLLAGIAAASFGWRSSYLFFAIPGLILASLFPFLKIKEKSHHELPIVLKNNRKGESNKTLLILSIVGIMFVGFCYRGATTFLPAHMGENVTGFFSTWLSHSSGVAKGGVITTVVLLIGVLGQYTGGRLVGRIRMEILYGLLIAISVPFVILIGLSTNSPMILFASIFAFFHFGAQPVGNVLVSTFSFPQRRGFVFGLSFFLTFSFGSFAASFSGLVAEKFGLSYVFIALGAISMVPIIIALIINRLRKKDLEAFTTLKE